MKMKWASGLMMLVLMSAPVLADSDIPTDEVLKKQFFESQEGLMQLDSINLRLLDSRGNQATYAAEGDISATDDLYAMVGMAGNYQFMEKTWTKGRPVKFSAMVTAVGTRDSGWTTEFFSMQMAAKAAGYPQPDINDKAKYLVITDSDFYPRLAKIEATWAAQKKQLDASAEKQNQLQQQIEALDAKMNASWGKDKNGKPLTRSAVQQVLLNDLQDMARQNDPLYFENNYNKTIYEPALAACQKKPDCDATPLRTARDAALKDQRREYHLKFQLRRNQVTQTMDAYDKKLEPLRKKRNELHSELNHLDINSTKLRMSYDSWQREIATLRRKGIIK